MFKTNKRSKIASRRVYLTALDQKERKNDEENNENPLFMIVVDTYFTYFKTRLNCFE